MQPADESCTVTEDSDSGVKSLDSDSGVKSLDSDSGVKSLGSDSGVKSLGSDSGVKSLCCEGDGVAPRDNGNLLNSRDLDLLYLSDDDVEDVTTQTKKKKNSLKKKNVKVDLTFARSSGPVVEMSVRKLNWKCYTAPLAPNPKLSCQIYWQGMSREDHIVPKGSYVSRFPGLGELCHKKNLALALNRMRELFPDEFAFHPRSWLLPEQYEQFLLDTQEHSKPKKFYILKPNEGSQGEGIYLFSNPKDKVSLFANPSMVQEYIPNPLLLEGYKFDVRLYVLLLSADPVEAYVSRTGMARFCTETYKHPSVKNTYKSFMHLTNYSLNKRSEDYQHTDEPDTGSKRMVGHVFEDMEQLGHDVDLVWEKIDTVVVRTLQAMCPEIKIGIHSGMRRGILPSPDSCFQILGFDLLFDDKLNVYLLEVNSHPSLCIDFDEPVPNKPGVTTCILSQVDINIKLPVVQNALQLARRRQIKGPGVPIEIPEGSVYKRVAPDLVVDNLYALVPIADMFMQFLKREAVTLGSSAFRSFLRFYKLAPALVSTAEADLLFLKATRSFTGYELNAINFQQFYYILCTLAGLNFKLDSQVENLSLLVEFCLKQK